MEIDTLSSVLTVDEQADFLRRQLKKIGAELDNLRSSDLALSSKQAESRGEIIANLTLAYRHIEDASMRIGKVKQHLNAGVSIYDKNVVGSPEKSDEN